VISIELVQYLRPNGILTDTGQEVWEHLTFEEKLSFFRWMSLVREFDRRCVHLQRLGKIGTYAPLEGQEAAQVGSALVLRREDWVFPSYREHGAAMVVGMPMSQLFLYWMGRIEGCRPPEGVRLLPVTVPIATQLPQATGAAWAAKLKRESFVSVAYFGDGATSEGDFHEACNFAGVFRVPVIFFCQNNGYAISVPFVRQSASPTVAEKAQAYAFPGVRVDGNDVIAVYDVMRQAVERARNGQGPTLIEAVTYRKGAHTTADDESRYRPRAEVEMWKSRDPLERYVSLLKTEGLLSDQAEQDWYDTCKAQVEDAFSQAIHQEPPPPEHMFSHVFSELPVSLKKQRAELQREEQVRS
jgi:pyruvate dehydrogenase E1 component alpha subunit